MQFFAQKEIKIVGNGNIKNGNGNGNVNGNGNGNGHHPEENCDCCSSELKNIYYLGIKQSEAEQSFDDQTMDGFFAGSITQYGNNKRGNIAYNATSGVQLSKAIKYAKRNDRILTRFTTEQCRHIVADDPDAWFFPFDPEIAAYVPEELKHRIICCVDPKIYAQMDSKFIFRDVFNKKLPFPPYRYMMGNELLDKIESGEYPAKKEVVAQLEYGAAGYGTYIINKKYFANATFRRKAIADIEPDEKYVVSDYIPNIGVSSVHMLVSNNEVIVLPSAVFHSYKDHHKLSGMDLGAYQALDEKLKKETERIATVYGKYIQKSKKYPMRGWLHLDVMYGEDGKTYVMEANPRVGGSIGLQNRIFREAELDSVFTYIYKCHYDEKTNFAPDIAKLVCKGRYRHARVVKDKDGELVSIEDPTINREGFDLTEVREDNIYTHSVYESGEDDGEEQ